MKKNVKENVNYIIKTPKKSVIPRSEKQKNYVKALRDMMWLSHQFRLNKENLPSCCCSINYVTR